MFGLRDYAAVIAAICGLLKTVVWKCQTVSRQTFHPGWLLGKFMPLKENLVGTVGQIICDRIILMYNSKCSNFPTFPKLNSD